MADNDITFREYWSEVESLAREAWEEDRNEEEAREWVWETVDGHQWVIYTAFNFDVLKLSPNDGYTVENFGSDGIVEGGAMQWHKLAFGALYADVMEKLDDVRPDFCECGERATMEDGNGDPACADCGDPADPVA